MTAAQRNSRQVRDAIRRHRAALRRYRRDESHDVEVWFTEEYGLHYAGEWRDEHRAEAMRARSKR